MALVRCPDCGGHVSVNAKACPHCGAARRAQASPLTLVCRLFFGVGLIVLGVVFVLTLDNGNLNAEAGRTFGVVFGLFLVGLLLSFVNRVV